MNNFRKFVYAAVLTVSALSLAPSTASAQEAVGKFTLVHDVRWQNATVPAGDYKFTIDTNGPSPLLTLAKISGVPKGFLILVTDTDAIVENRDPGRLLLVSRSGQTFVSAMQLNEIGVTLHFTVPQEPAQIASAATAATTASR